MNLPDSMYYLFIQQKKCPEVPEMTIRNSVLGVLALSLLAACGSEESTPAVAIPTASFVTTQTDSTTGNYDSSIFYGYDFGDQDNRQYLKNNPCQT